MRVKTYFCMYVCMYVNLDNFEDKRVSLTEEKTCLSVILKAFLLINAPRVMKNMDGEPLFCTQFAKQKVCPIFYFYFFFCFTDC